MNKKAFASPRGLFYGAVPNFEIRKGPLSINAIFSSFWVENNVYTEGSYFFDYLQNIPQIMLTFSIFAQNISEK
jgi:hypothetical protein